MTLRALLAWVVVLWLAGAAHDPAWAAGTVKHSGILVGYDRQRGALVIEEVGPWSVEGGVTRVTRRTIVVTPQTVFSLFVRVNPPGGFAGAFVEGELAMSELSIGDYVTAECRVERGRLIAIKISWASPEEP